MTAHPIESAIDGQGIATITIDRPEKRNAMTYAMLAEFTRAVGAMGEDPSVRMLIITGAGGAFCAGTDLADLATIPGDVRGARGSAEEHEAWWLILRYPKPAIGAVDRVAAAPAEAARHLKSSPFSIGKIKALTCEGMGRDVAEHMRAPVSAIAACFKSEDHKEGVASFLEKRPAKFVGR